MSYGDKRWREWVISGDEAREHFAAALEAGVNFFDTADVYSTGVSEEITGRWPGEMASRDEIVLATKVNGPMGAGPNRRGLSRKHILEACDASLRRLKTDFIDLYQIHRWDFRTPIEETLDALYFLVRAGKVRYLGASSMAAWQFSKALYTAGERGWHGFVSMQNHYNLVYREEEREMIPLCIDQGVGVIPWSPLARGFLAGNRRSGDTGETLRARTDEMARGMYFPDSDFVVAEAAAAVARARRYAGPDRVCVDFTCAGSHRADHRRDQTQPRQGTDRVGRDQVDAGRGRGARAALSASSGARLRAAETGQDAQVRCSSKR
jgi:1-deoxyxylulose-5-phosphate synthase